MSGQASCSNQCNIVNDMVMGASMGAIVKLPSISKRGHCHENFAA